MNTNVNMTVVFPGAVKTNITKNSGLREMNQSSEAPKILSAKTAAQIISDGMENNQYRVFVGKDSKFMDFYKLFFFSSLTAWSAALAVKAI